MASHPANIGLARVDLLAFTLAVTSYAELVGGQAEGATKEVLESARKHCIRTDVSELLTGLLESFLRTFESEPSQPQMLISGVRLAEAKRGMARFLNVGSRLPAILNWFQTHRDNFTDVLPGPAASSAQSLLKLGDIQDPQQRLKALGEFTFRSTLKVLRRWIMEEALLSLKLQPVGVAATKADIAATKPYVDQLQRVEMGLAAADSGSEDAADLSEQRVALQGDLDDIVKESSNPMAVETAVSNALTENPLTELARKYGLDEDQAAVVASTGNVVVSAGAGSGKTHTLLRVVQESLARGYRPDQILGTTFTRKAKNEFNERMVANGVTGVRFGTTHSIAGEIILFCDPKLAPQLKDPMKRANSVFDLAIKQVSMRATGSVPPDLVEKPIVPDGEKPIVPDGEKPSGDLVAEHLVRVRAMIRKHPWADFLKDLEKDLMRPKPYPLKGRALEFLVKMENQPAGRRRASDDDLHTAAEAAPDAAPDSGKTKYWNTPANMWWNLGIDPRDSKKGLRTRIGRWQNGGDSWQSIWKLHGSLPVPSGDDISALYEAAAVYAAYVWLKQNDPQYGPVLDMDDWLGKAVELLKRKPKALGTLQDRYKVMIVDEAQDLNGLQWELFGMLSKKTDRYLLVGDDFQSIYKFRGASADQFIKKPEEGFQLLQMGTNYRSGKNIVETANQLIAINPDQIKKTCRAARHNGDGSIEARIVPTHGDVARETAETIDSMIEAGSKPSDFGIGVRNNAEMDAFCLALMAKRIPFVCKRDPLEGTIPRITLSWFTLAVGLEAGREQVNTAITTAHQNPGFFLDKVFNENLRAAVPKGSDQLTTLLNGFEAYGGTQQRRNRNVHAYANAIRGIQNYAKSDDLLRAILEIRGQTGDTFFDRLIDEVDPEDVDPSLTGEDREKAMKDAASIPLEPLFGIAEAIPNPLDFMTFIDKMRRAQAALKKGQKDEETDEPAVRIETAHGWKGLECEHMFVVMADGVFPNAYAADEEDGKGFEEERRLAYVAVTRGKKSVTVYSPLESYRGPRPTPPGQPPRLPSCSIFVDEMENGCMPVHGRELLMPGGGGGRLPPLSRDEDEDEEEEDAPEGRKFARQLVSSMDTDANTDPLDPHWGELV